MKERTFMGIPIKTDDEIVAMGATILCVRVADVPAPYVPSAQTDCARCGEPCWLSMKASVPLVERGLRVVCMQCALADEHHD